MQKLRSYITRQDNDETMNKTDMEGSCDSNKLFEWLSLALLFFLLLLLLLA
jgi:hypothetical protein